TDFNGHTTTYERDELRRVTARRPDPRLAEEPVIFEYTPTGLRARMTDGSGTTAYAWDERNRLVEKSTPAGTLMYAYDEAGNRKSMRSDAADGVAVDYEYDATGRLDSVTDRSAGGGATSYDYDVAGNLKAYQHANGVRTTFGFNQV